MKHTPEIISKARNQLLYDLNINGRICLPVTLCFGAGGVVIVRYILPVFESAGGQIPKLVWESASLVLMGLFAADFKPAQVGSKVKGLEEEFRKKVYSAAGGLSRRQRHIMRNIRSFRPARVYHYSLHAGQKLKEALLELRRRPKDS